MTPTPHRIPGHLSEGSQTWLAGVRDDLGRAWTPSEWRLALLAAEAWDRAQRARRQLDREGLTFTVPVFSKDGEHTGDRITAHPANAIARDNTATLSKLLAQLGLDRPAEPEEEGEAPEEDKPKGILTVLADRRVS